MRTLHRHATLAAVVETVLGSPDVPEIAMTSATAPGVTHRWTNMRVYAAEVSNARIWAGFHYRFSTVIGAYMGRRLGEYVARTIMQPAAMATR